MMNQTNPSIKCTVNSCSYHKDQHCTLNEIQVGHCQNSVCDCKETECASFKLGDHTGSTSFVCMRNVPTSRASSPPLTER